MLAISELDLYSMEVIRWRSKRVRQNSKICHRLRGLDNNWRKYFILNFPSFSLLFCHFFGETLLTLCYVQAEEGVRRRW